MNDPFHDVHLGRGPGGEELARCWWKRWPKSGSLWDSPAPAESAASTRRRHQEARIECLRCPLLDACEKALSDMEARGVPVDGVMAGRYSDTPTAGTKAVYVQSHCRGCERPMRPQAVDGRRAFADAKRRHVGEGLCHLCYPTLKRHP